ncbi:T9SS type A sorting domain-containing protein [Pontibacter chitinilyticus]|uniref:T9SS type A sorting domain-containing protein n=1 Tax=Pontibacter chitinilyticus TaxID=2674989 RepID=UPI00321AAD8D
MRTSTFYKTLFISLFILYLPLQAVKAQAVPDPIQASCSYEGNCVLVTYEAVQEDSSNPNNLTLLLSVFVSPNNTCGIDVVYFSAAQAGALLTTRTVAQLANNPYVELTVSRAAFLQTPDVIISTFRYIGKLNLPISIPPIIYPVPLAVIDLEARLDGDSPCLPVTPLPVELVAFEGKASKSDIVLEWNTASEKDNKQFEVERSTDGQTFSQLGIVAGHGNSSTALKYSYTDQRPGSGTNYYRLKQVDFSGTSKYSKVIDVAFKGVTSDALQVALFPNPCQVSNCNISLSNIQQTPETQLELQDLSGKVVYRKTIRNEGRATYKLPLQDLGPHKGLFILTATSGQQVVRQRVVLQ